MLVLLACLACLAGAVATVRRVRFARARRRWVAANSPAASAAIPPDKKERDHHLFGKRNHAVG